MSFIYLASPYSDPRPSTRIRRMKRALAASAELTKNGLAVFAPIPIGWSIEEKVGELPHAFWLEWCIKFLRQSSHLYVLTLPGWRESKGVKTEVLFAVDKQIPIIGCDILTECEDVSGFDIKRYFLAESSMEVKTSWGE